MDSGKEADEWFRRLEEQAHELFDEEKKRKDAGIKTAILDTGIDGGHKSFQAGKRRIRAYKSWVMPIVDCEKRSSGVFSSRAMREDFKDEIGHGTHAAALLLKVDPWAHIYVARVARDGDSGIRPQSYH